MGVHYGLMAVVLCTPLVFAAAPAFLPGPAAPVPQRIGRRPRPRTLVEAASFLETQAELTGGAVHGMFAMRSRQQLAQWGRRQRVMPYGLITVPPWMPNFSPASNGGGKFPYIIPGINPAKNNTWLNSTAGNQFAPNMFWGIGLESVGLGTKTPQGMSANGASSGNFDPAMMGLNTGIPNQGPVPKGYLGDGLGGGRPFGFSGQPGGVMTMRGKFGWGGSLLPGLAGLASSIGGGIGGLGMGMEKGGMGDMKNGGFGPPVTPIGNQPRQTPFMVPQLPGADWGNVGAKPVGVGGNFGGLRSGGLVGKIPVGTDRGMGMQGPMPELAGIGKNFGWGTPMPRGHWPSWYAATPVTENAFDWHHGNNNLYQSMQIPDEVRPMGSGRDGVGGPGNIMGDPFGGQGRQGYGMNGMFSNPQGMFGNPNPKGVGGMVMVGRSNNPNGRAASGGTKDWASLPIGLSAPPGVEQDFAARWGLGEQDEGDKPASPRYIPPGAMPMGNQAMNIGSMGIR